MELMLIFMGGLLGSSHCVGMCGGFAVIVGMRASGARRMAMAQSLFTLGRIFTYTTMGAVAGAVGARAFTSTRIGINLLAMLSIVGGVLLLYQGLSTLGVRLMPRRVQAHVPCLLVSGYRSLLHGEGWSGTFLAGMATGLLPCGLVYGFVTLAAATGDLMNGALVMSLFGLGTAPLMIATGWGGALLSGMARARLFKAAACCVVLMGAVTLVRGIGHLRAPAESGRPVCPFCLDY